MKSVFNKKAAEFSLISRFFYANSQILAFDAGHSNNFICICVVIDTVEIETEQIEKLIAIAFNIRNLC